MNNTYTVQEYKSHAFYNYEITNYFQNENKITYYFNFINYGENKIWQQNRDTCTIYSKPTFICEDFIKFS